MAHLKANKTSLYRLVYDHDDSVGGIRHCKFRKSFREPDYFLDWSNDGLYCHAFFAATCGRALLSIEKKDIDGQRISRDVYTLDIGDLRTRGMVEDEPKRP